MKYKKNYLYILTIFFFIISSPSLSLSDSVSRRNAVVLAVEKVGNAVVNINTEETVRDPFNPFGNFNNNLMDDFFKDFFLPPQGYKRQSLGSGVIISPEGYILTNEHVISKGDKIKITMIDKREFEARLIGADARSDLAVIKIEGKGKFPYSEMKRSDDIMIGETVIAIGNPFGLSHTVTTGIVSALNRSIKGDGGRVYSDFIQVDSSINPGNSGGPLLNINGDLIGINTAIYQKAEGIGFAIPIDRAKRIVDDLINYGEVHEAWIGLSVQELTNNLSTHFKFDNDKKGVVVNKIFKGSPAEEAGIKNGDIIVAIGKKDIEDKDDYQDQVSSYSADDNINIKLFRDGKYFDFTVRSINIPQKLAFEITKDWLGIDVTEITKDMIDRYNLYTDSGMVITDVEKKSKLYGIGVREGDVLKQINSAKIDDVKEFQKAVLNVKKTMTVVLLIQRGRKGYYISIEP